MTDQDKKEQNFKRGAKLLEIIVGSIAGGGCIALGTYASKVCPYPILAPLLFSVGILLVMVFNFELITRRVPTKGFNLIAVIVLLLNLLTAWLLGLAFDYEFNVVPTWGLLFQSILGGIVIGLVSLNNTIKSEYKWLVAILLMYIFVMTGMPHCVVYAFLGVDFPTLFTVIVGNIIGGVVLETVVSWHRIAGAFALVGHKFNSKKDK